MTLPEQQLDSLAELEADLINTQREVETAKHYRDQAVRRHARLAKTLEMLKQELRSRLAAGEISENFELRETAQRVEITGQVPDAYMVAPAPTPNKPEIKRHLQESGDTNWARLIGGKALHRKVHTEMPDVGF